MLAAFLVRLLVVTFTVVSGMLPATVSFLELDRIRLFRKGQVYLGGRTKSKIKALAKEIGWCDLADRPESQDFIEASNYGVLFQKDEIKPGPIVTSGGEQIGTHQGIVNYTVGQRRGLGGGSSEPLYVTGIDGPSNIVRVGTSKDLYSKSCLVSELSWMAFLNTFFILPDDNHILRLRQFSSNLKPKI